MSEPISWLASGSPAPDECDLPGPEGQLASLGETHDPSWQRRGFRRLDRFPVAGTRPIALRFLQAEGQSPGPWVLADILDISQGASAFLSLVRLSCCRPSPWSLTFAPIPDSPGYGWKLRPVGGSEPRVLPPWGWPLILSCRRFPDWRWSVEASPEIPTRRPGHRLRALFGSRCPLF